MPGFVAAQLVGLLAALGLVAVFYPGASVRIASPAECSTWRNGSRNTCLTNRNNRDHCSAAAACTKPLRRLSIPKLVASGAADSDGGDGCTGAQDACCCGDCGERAGLIRAGG